MRRPADLSDVTRKQPCGIQVRKAQSALRQILMAATGMLLCKSMSAYEPRKSESQTFAHF